MKVRNSNAKFYGGYSIVLGLLYIVLGVLDVLSGLGLFQVPFIASDVIGGIMLMIVGVIFLHVIGPIRRSDIEGYAFLHVGVLLAALLFGLQVVIILTNVLGWIAGLEDWAGWTITQDLTPTLWLFLIVLPLAAMIHQRRRRTRHDRLR